MTFEASVRNGHTVICVKDGTSLPPDSIVFSKGNDKYATSRTMYEIDAYIAAELKRRTGIPRDEEIHVDDKELDREQRAAISTILSSGVSILTGPPGNIKMHYQNAFLSFTSLVIPIFDILSLPSF
jgi:hypothetical protein